MLPGMVVARKRRHLLRHVVPTPDARNQGKKVHPQERLSLIIATRNRAKQLRATLGRLDLEDIHTSNTEVILVDNASNDDTATVLEEFRRTAGVPVITITEDNLGSGNARNAGLKAASGAYRIFTDDDCYLENGYLSKARRVFSEQDIHYGGGRTLLFDESDAPETINTVCEPAVFPPFLSLQPGQILGANMFFKKEITQRVGGFDPLFGTGTPFPCDDLEYATRCSLAGYTGHYIPDLVVYHHHGRKRDSPEMAQRMGEYYHGIGAFHMRSLLGGRWERPKQFASQWLHNRALVFHGLCGALHYLGLRAFGVRRV
jgi:GT2 family glycosyltransferase